jgi:hypothetical protein
MQSVDPAQQMRMDIRSVEIAREVIGVANKPLPIDILYKTAQTQGFVTNTKKPNMTYGARIRDQKARVGLTFLKGFGWWLEERPFAAAKYFPSTNGRASSHVN